MMIHYFTTIPGVKGGAATSARFTDEHTTYEWTVGRDVRVARGVRKHGVVRVPS